MCSVCLIIVFNIKVTKAVKSEVIRFRYTKRIINIITIVCVFLGNEENLQ